MKAKLFPLLGKYYIRPLRSVFMFQHGKKSHFETVTWPFFRETSSHSMISKSNSRVSEDLRFSKIPAVYGEFVDVYFVCFGIKRKAACSIIIVTANWSQLTQLRHRAAPVIFFHFLVWLIRDWDKFCSLLTHLVVGHQNAITRLNRGKRNGGCSINYRIFS